MNGIYNNKISKKFREIFLERPLVLHPFLFGIYFILDGFGSIANYVPLYEIFLPIFLMLLFIFGLYLLIIFLVNDKLKAGIISSVILIPLLFYLRIFELVVNIFPALGRTRYIVLGSCILISYFIWLVLKTKKDLVYLTSYLNILTLIYIFYGMALITVNIKDYKDWSKLQVFNQGIDYNSSSVDINNLPDIYYIILDSYTSSGSLNKYFNYDNSNFTNSLIKRGFYIAEKSKSLYGGSLRSIASVLNMSNDKELLNMPDTIVLKLIENSAIVTFLRYKTYDIVNLSPFKLADIPQFYNFFYITEKARFNFYGLFHRTAIFQIIIKLQPARLYKTNLDILNLLKKISYAKQKRPKFIYAHLMTPHAPYCFDQNGNIIPWFNRKLPSDISGYLEQLIFTNKIILDLVENILTNSLKEPIIIIQGDHGFRFLNNSDKGFESRTVLNAYYLPGGGERLLYPSIPPLNTFRVIFNYYFGTEYKLLEDEKDSINSGQIQS